MSSTLELIKQLGDKELAVAFYAFQALKDKVTLSSRSGSEAAKNELASEMTTELNTMMPAGKDERGHEIPPSPKHSVTVRNKILQLLGTIADAVEVSALSSSLKDLETREMARFLLDRNPSQESTSALIVALEEVGPEFRVGVVNTLGRRQGGEVLAALKTLLADKELEVRIAAVEALSNYPVPGNDASIAGVEQSASAEYRIRIQKARIRLAETFRLAGNKTEATRIYHAVQASDAGTAQKKAAEIGLKALG